MSDRLMHPAILVGYGDYGLRALRRLLTSASPRGFLAWERDEGGGSPGKRKLRDLELIWVPEHGGKSVSLPGGYLVKDLYSQIVEIAANPVGESLKAELLRAKDRLISAERLGLNAQATRPGVDIFVLAQPARVETLGLLEETLQPALEVLARDPTLRRRAGGADLLNLTALLDFDKFWENPAMQREVRAWVTRWKERGEANTPHFGRVFISDGQVESGRREESLRLEETVLFLEFLLFEGLRAEHLLRRLYQPADASDTEPLAAFGIRVIERSGSMLSRLAAAKFGCGWLGYMSAKETTDTAKARASVSRELDPYRPASLDLTPAREELDDRTKRKIRQIQDGLISYTQIHADEANWPERICERALVEIAELKSETAHWAADRASKLIRQHLGDLKGKLNRAVTTALHAPYHSAPLGLVLEELETLQSSLTRGAIQSDNATSDMMADFAGMEEVHARYLKFRSLQVNTGHMASNFWLIFSILLATAWTPVLVEAVREAPKPEPIAPFLLRQAFVAIQPLSHYLAAGLLLLFVVFVTCRFLVHRWIQKRTVKGTSVFLDRDQGELTDRIRKAVNNEQFRLGIGTHIEQMYETLVRRVQGEIQRELSAVIRRLNQRRSEMDWLRLQLQEFLRTHGIDANDPSPSIEAQQTRSTLPRLSIERDEDFKRALKRHPENVSEYQMMQGRQQPFRSWDASYSSDFLYPLAFLDDLSREYLLRPDEEILAKDAEVERKLRSQVLQDFISRYGKVPIGMDWKKPDFESYCVIPELWHRLEGVDASLNDQAYGSGRIIVTPQGERLYLVRTHVAVGIDLLMRPDEVHRDAR